MSHFDRRGFLSGLATAGAGGAAVVLDPVRFEPVRADPVSAAGGARRDQTRTLSGLIPYGAPDWVYIPVEVPDGVSRISVSYGYDRPAPPPGHDGNALDLGVFDEHGYEPGNAAGFRGWSGGSRTAFTISGSDATPGYLPGPVGKGTWHLVLGPYTVAPEGIAWTITVTLGFGPPGPAAVPRPAPHRATGRGRAWYRGDLHLHTVHSDGVREPGELAAAARAANLDFVVSTEHNTSSAAAVWGAHAGPDLLVIDGEEVTTRNGHLTALGLPAGTWVDWRYRAVDGVLPGFLADIHRVGGLAVAAHPYAPCLGCAWKFGYAGLDAIEVWNGPWTLDDEAAVATWDNLLVAGSWSPAVGGSDAHGRTDTVGLPQSVVYAADLDRRSVLDAIRAGRLWLAESGAVNLSFTASARGHQAGVGQRLEVADDVPVTVTLTVDGAPGCAVRLVTDQGQRLLAALPAHGPATMSWTTTPRNARYVRAEVRRPQPTATTADTMVALTNPIFLGRSAAAYP
jgi:hypothetical protein